MYKGCNEGSEVARTSQRSAVYDNGRVGCPTLPKVMKIIIWNCHGLRTPWAIPALHLLIRQHDPYIMFLCETKLARHELEKVKGKLGFSCGVAVDSNDKRGGLGLIWRNDIQVTLQAYNNHMIDVRIQEDDSTMWHFTGLYRHPSVAERTIS